MFVKEQQPTKILFVGNVLDKTPEKIKHFFDERYGKCQVADVRMNCCYITFDDINESIRAQKELHKTTPEEFGGRKLRTAFARLGAEECPESEGQPDSGIPTIKFQEDFITKDEEKELIEYIDDQEWEHVLKRRTQHYGFAFDYERLFIDRSRRSPIPEKIQTLIGKLKEAEIIDRDAEPDQITINEYMPGEGIGYHVDSHSSFGGYVCVVPLLCGTNFEFRKINRKTQNENKMKQPIAISSEEQSDWDRQLEVFAKLPQRRTVWVPSRSALSFSDLSRYAFQHGIIPRMTDKVNGEVRTRSRRVSVTIRTAGGLAPCRCPFPFLCDGQNPNMIEKPSRVVKTIKEEEVAC
eukprot:Trichotokara_eunicae@DN5120_c0_g1_i2.p1